MNTLVSNYILVYVIEENESDMNNGMTDQVSDEEQGGQLYFLGVQTIAIELGDIRKTEHLYCDRSSSSPQSCCRLSPLLSNVTTSFSRAE
jgi:hypothetical protein